MAVGELQSPLEVRGGPFTARAWLARAVVACLMALFAATTSACLIFASDPDPPVPANSDLTDSHFDADATDTLDDVEPDSILFDSSTDSLDDFESEDYVDSGLDSGPQFDFLCEEDESRCAESGPQVCAEDGLSWVDDGDCGTEICRAGECVALPADYGRHCYEEAPCPDELICIDGACLTQEPRESGFDCTDSRECIPPGWCNGSGVCTLGLDGDPCNSDIDCDHPAYVCGPDRLCHLGRDESPCFVGVGCGEGFVCGPSDECQRGEEGDPCTTPAEHCSPIAPICGPDGTCQDGGAGDSCEIASDCVSNIAVCMDGECATPGAGADCSEDQICPVMAPICGPDDLCQVGLRGDSCSTDEHCLVPLLCGPDETCHDGAEGDDCETTTHCSTSAPICFHERCQDGGLGDACRSSLDCGPTGPICGPSQTCRVGQEGDRCVVDDHCGEIAPYCVEGRCRNGSVGDPCDTADDCSPDAGVCGPLGCQVGAAGDPCLTDQHCDNTAEFCGPNGCQSGVEGNPCIDSQDCGTTAPLCGPTACQNGDEGDSCASANDCDDLLSPFCASDGQCHDGTAGDACTNDAQCVEVDLCGPNGCQAGVEGDPCVNDDDCSDATAPFCAPDELCHNGSAGDSCSIDEQCVEVDYCGPDGCQAGVEYDTCGDDNNCDPSTAPFCASDGLCHDGSTGDSCLGDGQCVEVPLCGPNGCQVGSEGDPCAVDADCDALIAPFCASDGLCHDGTLGDPCLDDTQCLSDPVWGTYNCTSRGCEEADFVYVPNGTFTMGCPAGVDVDCRPGAADTPETEVILTRPFLAQIHEVTQTEWYERLETEPSDYTPCFPSVETCLYPVEKVTWYAALLYANTLSLEFGLEECYVLTTCKDAPSELECEGVSFAGFDCTGYRLPTEAEWEYLARGGTAGDYYSGELLDGQVVCNENAPAHLGSNAWFCGNKVIQTQPVRTRTANEWGIHDVAGNVHEWVWDLWGDYPLGPLTDPLGAATGSSDRVYRGGHYDGNPRDLQHGSRFHRSPKESAREIGFRLVRSLPRP